MSARSLAIKYTFVAAICTFGLAARPAFAQKKLSDYVQPGLRDVSASIRILSHDDRELAKIGKGYADAYKLGSQEIWAKEPGQVKYQGKKGFITLRFITSGNRKLTEVSHLRIRKVDDISKEPGKGDSISDLGLVTQAWVDQVEDRWLRTETRDGKTLQVFEYWHKEDPRYRHTLWMDPQTKTIVDHIAHHRSQKRPGFKKRLVYSDAKQISGVWLPTTVTVYSGENKPAGQLRYERIQVNTGLPDSLFKI
jgi:hypothetical protein